MIVRRAGCAVAVLGAGHIHLRDLARVVLADTRIRVASVWDEDPALADGWAAALRADPHTDLSSALTAEDLQGALIYGRPSRHRRAVSAAVERGLAVFVEKPLAVTKADLAAVEAILRDARGFSTGFLLRYAPAFRGIRDAVARREVGRPTRATVRVVHSGLREGWFDGEYAWMREPGEGGGGFFDLVVHCLDLIAWVLGPIEEFVDLGLSASGHHGTAVVRTRSDVIVDVEAGWEAPHAAIDMTIAGTDGTLAAAGGRLSGPSTSHVLGQAPDAGAAPRAWLDTLAGRPDQPLVPLIDAVECARATIELRRGG
jgi:predicted dehydrogenase